MIFLTLSLQISSYMLFDLLGARIGKKTQPKPILLANPSFSPHFLLPLSQKRDLLFNMRPKTTFWSFKSLLSVRPCLAYTLLLISYFFSLFALKSLIPYTTLFGHPINPIFHFLHSNFLIHIPYNLSFISY